MSVLDVPVAVTDPVMPADKLLNPSDHTRPLRNSTTMMQSLTHKLFRSFRHLTSLIIDIRANHIHEKQEQMKDRFPKTRIRHNINAQHS